MIIIKKYFRDKKKKKDQYTIKCLFPVLYGSKTTVYVV